MKHLATLIQVLFWIIADSILFIYYLEWGVFMQDGSWVRFIKEHGIVRKMTNYKRNSWGGYENKYKAAFSPPLNR